MVKSGHNRTKLDTHPCPLMFLFKKPFSGMVYFCSVPRASIKSMKYTGVSSGSGDYEFRTFQYMWSTPTGADNAQLEWRGLIEVLSSPLFVNPTIPSITCRVEEGITRCVSSPSCKSKFFTAGVKWIHRGHGNSLIIWYKRCPQYIVN